MDVRTRLLEAAAVCAAVGRIADHAEDSEICDQMTNVSARLLAMVYQLTPEVTLLADWTIAEADVYVRSLKGAQS